MSTDTSTTESANRTATVPEWDDLPCVQYGFPRDEGPARTPKLRTIFEPIPDGAITASPVYIVPRERYEYQSQRENPHRLSGDHNLIATEVQDECEDDKDVNRVLYPVHIESDELRTEGPETLMRWFCEFVQDYLEVPFHTCSLYFSGNRSIHVHVPRFVKGEDNRKHLKELAETFCEETGAELDLSLYHRKSLFRIPGVKHQKTGMPKIEFDGEWDNAQLAQKVEKADPCVPESYAEVLRRVFVSQESLTVGTVQPSSYEPHDLFDVLDSEKTVLEFETEERAIETPLIERVDDCPDDPAKVPEWSMYNAHEFSPYALASGNSRSVAALKVKRGAFARKQKRDRATMIPAYFYGAIGCSGEFTKEDVHAPLQLSKKDYRKWDYESGATVVIIGGKSGSSVLLDVDVCDATVVGHALSGEDGSRQAALDYLSDQGYDVGSAGSKVSDASSRETPSGEARSIWPARTNPQTAAEELQLKAEQEGIETLSHDEKIQVACRHLQYGWDATWEWFEEQFGSAFKPEVTRKNFCGIVESFEGYDDVEVPEKPA